MTHPDAMYDDTVAANLPRILEDIEDAAARSGRSPAAVEVIAVTKGHPATALEAVIRAGLPTVGENRLEELRTKQDALGRTFCRWHMIGHLQGRKAPQVHGRVDLLHSVDSVRLAERLDRTATAEPATPDRLPVLIQVNVAGEEAKSGLDPDRAEEEIARILELPGLDVRGLMTMAPWTDDDRVLRNTFSGLRVFSEQVRSLDPRLGPELSMGMSNDYPIAVEEGSTMVRIGTALLGERPR